VNPSVCVKPDGKILLIYKSASHKTGLLKIGLAGAESYDGKYSRISEEPIFEFGAEIDDWNAKGTKHVEDPYMWYNGITYELIMKDMTGDISGEEGGGIHATSEDGIEWEISKSAKAYSNTVLWSDGKKNKQAAFERPQLLIENGKPTHLFVATAIVSDDKSKSFQKTWNMCIPLNLDPKDY